MLDVACMVYASYVPSARSDVGSEVCRLKKCICLAKSETAEHKEKLRLAEEVRLAEREAAEVCVGRAFGAVFRHP